VKDFILKNPYLSLCTPPVLLVLQFITVVALLGSGLPHWNSVDTLRSALLLTAFFALFMPAIPAALLAVRHLIYDGNKVLPAVGLLFNAAYILGFTTFFVLFFVTRSTD
jgi:hypothetical protein